MKNNQHLIVSVFITLLALALWSLRDFQFADDRGRNQNTFVILMTHYGTDAETLEKTITLPLEKRLKSVRGLSSLKSRTEYEKVRITLEMKESYNYSESYLDIRDRVYSLYEKLPESVQKPHIFSDSGSQDPAVILSVKNDSLSDDELQLLAEEKIKKAIEKAEESGEVQLGGYQPQEIIVDVDKKVAASLNINPVFLGELLKKNYTRAGVGLTASENFRWTLTFDSRLDSTGDIGELPVPVEGGGFVKLSTLAQITEKKKSGDSISRINGERRLVYYIKLSGKGSALSLSEEIRRLIEKESVNHTEFEILYDMGEELKESIWAFIKNILLCMAVVSFFILLAVRKAGPALLVTVSIPFYALLTLTLLHLMKLPVGLSTLMGLGLAIGTVADSGIIIICASRKERMSRTLVSSLISSALTTVLGTLPLIFSSGISVSVQRIALSFFFFVLLSTVLNLFFLRKVGVFSEIKLPLSFIPGIVKRILKLPRIPVLLFSSLILAGVVFVIVATPRSLNAGDASGIIRVHAEFPPGTTLKEIDRNLKRISHDIHSFSGVKGVETYARRKNGSLSVQLKSPSEGERVLRALEQIKNNYKDVQLFLPGGETQTKVSITITGNDPRVIEEYISSVSRKLKQSRIVYNYKEGSEVYTFKVNREAAALYGVSPRDIFTTMNWALNGPVALKWQDKKEKDLRIYIDRESYSSVKDLMRLPVQASEKSVPLGVLGEFHTRDRNNTIYRNNLQRCLTFTVFMNSKDITGIFSNLTKVFEEFPPPPGYSYHLDESLLESKKEAELLLFFILTAVFLIYAVLVVTLDSFVLPLIILVTIPLSLGFTAGAIYFMPLPFTTEVFVGFIIVMGIVVNNSILITEMFHDLYTPEKGVGETLLKAVKRRSAGILLTTGSTCVGFIPVLAGFSGVDENIKNLALVIFTGTLGSFPVGIFLFPLFLSMYKKRCCHEM